MSQHLLKLVMAIVIISVTGCDNICLKNPCDGRTDEIEFRLMRNDTNALFGPDAFISQDSIQTYLAFSPLVSTPVEFKPVDQTISLFIAEGAPVVLEINNIIQDTFSIITTQFGMDDCCLFYRADTVRMNELVICSGLCVAPIDLEI